MKKITLLLTLCAFLLNLNCFAQTTAIPDNAFETYLETHKADGSLVSIGDPNSMGNGVMDNLVLTANISGVELLSISYLGLGVSDLTGIEDFIALKELSCIQNSLTNLDLSNNTALISLNCNINNLTSLDLSNNSALTNIQCTMNNLVTLNIKNGNNLNITYFDASGNPNLLCVQVDDVNVGFFNSVTVPAYNDCTTTYIPDDAFEQKMIDLITIEPNVNNPDPTIDGYMITSDIIEYIDKLNSGGRSLALQSSDITNLTGIEDFTNLRKLNCSSNHIVNLDLSSNTALTYLDCSWNYQNTSDPTTALNTLNVSGLTALTTLIGFENHHLSSVDVSGATALTVLDLSFNGTLTDLDLSSNVALTNIDLSINTRLTNIDLSSNVALTNLNVINNLDLTNVNIQNGNNTNLISFKAFDIPDLTCVQVDDVAFMDANWSAGINTILTSFSLNCGSTLGIADNTILEFGLYPNPATNQFTIVLQDSQFLEKVNIYNNIGQFIQTSNTQLIKTSHLASGLFFVEVITNLGKVTKKLIIE